MNKPTIRAIVRGFHLIVSIPILGYIYEPASEVQQYAGAVRLFFVPVVVFAGYWMYAGVVFALVGVALWLGSYRLFGFGGIVLSQLALFIVHKIWMVTRARRARQIDAPPR